MHQLTPIQGLKKKSRHPISAPTYKVDPNRIKVAAKSRTQKAGTEENTVAESSEAIIAEPKTERVSRPQRTARRRGSISINSHLVDKKENSEEAEEDLTSKPKDQFSYEAFYRLWKNYSESLIRQGKSILGTAMTVDKPALEGFNIICPVATKALEQQFDLISTELHAYLRKELNNYSITISTPVTEMENIKMAFTPREKYNYMLEINPALAEFVNKLKLDLL